MESTNVRIGLFGIGLEAYWSQFAGLEELHQAYGAKGCLGLPSRRRRRRGAVVSWLLGPVGFPAIAYAIRG